MPTGTKVSESLKVRLDTRAPVFTFSTDDGVTITWQATEARCKRWYSRKTRIITDGVTSICGSEQTGPTRNLCSVVTGATYALLVRETEVHEGGNITRFEVLKVFVDPTTVDFPTARDHIKAWHG